VQKRPNADGIIEQFDGFFADPQKQIGKQADVIAMLLVNPQSLAGRLLEANYDYYIARCRHLSSLSEPAYSIAANKIGRVEEAYRLFTIGAQMDLLDLHHCTGHTGHHSACASLVARSVPEGFCGMSVTAQQLSFDARLPRAWRSVEFAVRYRQHNYHVRLRDGQSLRIASRG
jgi:trehalose/maltose hydrolase-like predicted phosphorylase